MTEFEIVEGLWNALAAIMGIVSLFLGLVSGYLAALYFFLGQATFFLRTLAFGLLSIALAFLGGIALVVQTMQQGLLEAWGKLKSPVLSGDFRDPLPLPPVGDLTQQELGVGLGWAVAFTVYLALAFMTFAYRWPRQTPGA